MGRRDTKKEEIIWGVHSQGCEGVAGAVSMAYLVENSEKGRLFNISNKWHISRFFYFSRVATCGPPKLCVCFTERKSPVGTSHLQSEVRNVSLQSESLRCGAREL